jgi:putative intracellular protease/amidase
VDAGECSKKQKTKTKAKTKTTEEDEEEVDQPDTVVVPGRIDWRLDQRNRSGIGRGAII